MKNDAVKKNLMYVSGEDFYLFSYSIFIVLDVLGCNGSKVFRDYRKFAFLIEFVRDQKLNYILENSSGSLMNPVDKEHLFHSYSAGLGRRGEILKLLFTLEKRSYVTLVQGRSTSSVDVSLNSDSIPQDFLNREMFSREYGNVKRFTTLVKRLSTLKLDTMLERVYKNNGISTWQV